VRAPRSDVNTWEAVTVNISVVCSHSVKHTVKVHAVRHVPKLAVSYIFVQTGKYTVGIPAKIFSHNGIQIHDVPRPEPGDKEIEATIVVVIPEPRRKTVYRFSDPGALCDV
jgi:hypothetical protein